VPLNSDLPDFDQDLRTDDAVEFAFVTESDREVWGWSKRATTIASVGWYTIATTGSGRASTEFYIAEKRSSRHQTIHFIAANHYGNGSVINVLSNSSFGARGTVRYITILGNGTYDGAAVQIYIDEDTTPIECYVRRDKQSPGWAPVNFATSITEGYVEKKRIDLGAVGNGMGTTGDLSVSGKGSLPIGATYLQLPSQSAPDDIFTGTWSNISSSYAGDFFRAEGGNAASFGSSQGDENKSHDHRLNMAKARAASPVSGSYDRAGFTSVQYTSSSMAPIRNSGGSEARPVNQTIRVWKRLS
jgi:hypothetical protein